MEPLQFDSIESSIAAFERGEFLIVLDSPDRENEGDLIIAARHLTPQKTAFMVRHSSGYLCAPLSQSRAQQLGLAPMVPLAENQDPNGTAYTITVDAVPGALLGREGAGRDAVATTTGISALDRSRTCVVLGHPAATAADFRRPGHVVPLTARPGGVRARRGHTEAGWELCRLAGIEPEVAVIGELVEGEDEGEGEGEARVGGGQAVSSATGMMRAPECIAFGKKWGIKCCTIEDLVHHVEDKQGPLPSTNGGTM